jgi:mono/diheme cytochrome c family protein
MRRGPGLRPQRNVLVPPDSTAPRTGKVDFTVHRATADRLVNSHARTPESLASGEIAFRQFCVPCHGPLGQGDGPVGRLMGAPNLAGPLTQGRTDGYLYVYIRHGGVLMPGYGYGIKPQDAWDVVNYVRKLQGK